MPSERAVPSKSAGLDPRLARARMAFFVLWMLGATFQVVMTVVAAAGKTERLHAAGRPASLAMAAGMLGYGLLSLRHANGGWKRAGFGLLAALGAAGLALGLALPA